MSEGRDVNHHSPGEPRTGPPASHTVSVSKVSVASEQGECGKSTASPYPDCSVSSKAQTGLASRDLSPAVRDPGRERQV